MSLHHQACRSNALNEIQEEKKGNLTQHFLSFQMKLKTQSHPENCSSWLAQNEDEQLVTCHVHRVLTGGAAAGPVLSRHPKLILGIWLKISH